MVRRLLVLVLMLMLLVMMTTRIIPTATSISTASIASITTVTIAMTVSAMMAVTPWWRGCFLEPLVLLSHIGQKILTKLLRGLDVLRIGACNMKVHWLIAFTTSGMLDKSRATTFDLYSAASFLLNMLDVGAALSDDLGTKVEAGNWLQVNGYSLFWPLASTEFITFDGLWFAAAESPLVDEVGELLLHQFFDLGNRFLETFSVGAGDVKVQWGVLVKKKRSVLAVSN